MSVCLSVRREQRSRRWTRSSTPSDSTSSCPTSYHRLISQSSQSLPVIDLSNATHYFPSPSPQCRILLPSASLRPITGKKTTSILPQPAAVWKERMHWACYIVTHTFLVLCKENSWNRSLNSEQLPDNLPVLFLKCLLLVPPHASTETVSLMPWTSVSASAVQ